MWESAVPPSYGIRSVEGGLSQERRSSLPARASGSKVGKENHALRQVRRPSASVSPIPTSLPPDITPLHFHHTSSPFRIFRRGRVYTPGADRRTSGRGKSLTPTDNPGSTIDQYSILVAPTPVGFRLQFGGTLVFSC